MVLQPVSGHGAQQYVPVPERASCGTEYTFGAKNRLLLYATRIHELTRR